MRPASFREVRTYPRAAVTRAVFEQAAARQRWKIVEADSQSLTLKTPLSFWSLGERIEVSLGRVENTAMVDATSTCIYKTQWADWGKNERNIRWLFLEIDNVLGSEGVSQRCPLCSQCGYLLAGISSNFCPECGEASNQAQRPASQDVATLRNVAAFGVFITAIEIAICFLLGLVDLGRRIPGLPHGMTGAMLLLKVNFFSLLAIFGLHRLVGYFTRRRNEMRVETTAS